MSDRPGFIIEKNVKHGKGFQLRHSLPIPGVPNEPDTIVDDEPFTYFEVAAGAAILLRMYNDIHGTDYHMSDSIFVSHDALKENAANDLLCYRALKTARQSEVAEPLKHTLTERLEIIKSFNDSPEKDVTVDVVNGRTRRTIHGRGACKIVYLEAKQLNAPESITFLRDYSRLLATKKGVHKGASVIFKEIMEAETIEEGLLCVSRYYDQFITNEAEIFSMLGF